MLLEHLRSVFSFGQNVERGHYAVLGNVRDEATNNEVQLRTTREVESTNADDACEIRRTSGAREQVGHGIVRDGGTATEGQAARLWEGKRFDSERQADGEGQYELTRSSPAE